MEFREIALEVDDGIATITLDRPATLNAFTHRMGVELLAALDRTDADDAVRAVIVTGRGRAFCAGADLSGGGAILQRDEDAFREHGDLDLGGTLARRLLESAKPVIAAINGPAVGVGVSSTLPMDVRLASHDARFGFVFTRRGVVPEAASAWFLPRIVGISRAVEWVMSGRVFDADEALEAGLVRSLHAPDDLLPAARALAHEMTDHSAPVANAIARRMLWTMLDGSPADAHRLDSLGLFHLGRTPDAAEGVASFVERRPPRFPMTVSGDLPAYVHEWRAATDQRAPEGATYVAEDPGGASA
jgi:enoyl-CoA hydratase/carnithine racemase